MVEFTKAELQRMGRLENQEFSVRRVVGDNGQETDQLVNKGGWFGGRIARQHKINSGEDRTDKQAEYLRAKKDVLDSLKRIYGDEIGERAFRAHIGRTINGVHMSSSDHPITGRHIQRMMKTAEKEWNEQLILQRFNRDFRDFHGKVMSERATAGWMMSKSVGWKGPNGQPARFDNSEETRGQLRTYDLTNSDQERHDGRIPIGSYHYKLRGDRVSDERGRVDQSEPKGTPIARNFLGSDIPPIQKGDLTRFLEGDPGQKDGFWTLELELKRSLGGRRDHLIGFHVNRDDPDFINVFDANRCEARVPRAHFEDWLNKHLDGYGEMKGMTLRRSEESLLGGFKKYDGVWRWDQQVELRPFETNPMVDFAKNQLVAFTETPVEHGIYQRSWGDITRLKFVIEGDGDPVRLTEDNAQQQLLTLVHGSGNDTPAEIGTLTVPGPESFSNSESVSEDPDEKSLDPNLFFDEGKTEDELDQDACKALSCLLNQTIINSIDGATGEKFQLDTLDNKFVPFGTRYGNDIGCELSRDGDTIYLRFHKERNLYQFYDGGTGQNHRLSPHTDYLNCEATISVTIQELREAGRENRVPDFEIAEPPEVTLHIEGYRGRDDTRIPESGPPLTFAEALQRESLMTDEQWAPQLTVMKDLVGRQEIIRYGTGEDDKSFPIAFNDFAGSGLLALEVGGVTHTSEELVPLSLRGHSHLLFSDVAGGEREALELAKLIDRSLINQFTEEALMLNGVKPFQLQGTMSSSYQVRISSVDDDGVDSVEIEFSQAIDPRREDILLEMPEDERECFISMIVRVTKDDLRNGTPENFEVVRKPFLKTVEGPLLPPVQEDDDGLNVNLGEVVDNEIVGENVGENIGNPNNGNGNNDNVGNENVVVENVVVENIVGVNDNQVKENI